MAEGKLGISVVLNNESNRVFSILNKQLDEVNKKTELKMSVKSADAFREVNKLLYGKLGNANMDTIVRSVIGSSNPQSEVFEKELHHLRDTMRLLKKYIPTDFLESTFAMMPDLQKSEFMEYIYANRKKNATSKNGNKYRADRTIEEMRSFLTGSGENGDQVLNYLSSLGIKDELISSITNINEEKNREKKSNFDKRYRTALEMAKKFGKANAVLSSIDLSTLDSDYAKLIMPIDKMVETLKRLDELTAKLDTTDMNSDEYLGLINEIENVIGSKNAENYQERIKYIMRKMIGSEHADAIFNTIYSKGKNAEITSYLRQSREKYNLANEHLANGGTLKELTFEERDAKEFYDFVQRQSLRIQNKDRFDRLEKKDQEVRQQQVEAQRAEEKKAAVSEEIMQKALEKTKQEYTELVPSIEKYIVSLKDAEEKVKELFAKTNNGTTALMGKDEVDFTGYFQRVMTLNPDSEIANNDIMYLMFDRIYNKNKNNKIKPVAQVADSVFNFTDRQLAIAEKLNAEKTKAIAKNKELKKSEEEITDKKDSDASLNSTDEAINKKEELKKVESDVSEKNKEIVKSESEVIDKNKELANSEQEVVTATNKLNDAVSEKQEHVKESADNIAKEKEAATTVEKHADAEKKLADNIKEVNKISSQNSSKQQLTVGEARIQELKNVIDQIRSSRSRSEIEGLYGKYPELEQFKKMISNKRYPTSSLFKGNAWQSLESELLKNKNIAVSKEQVNINHELSESEKEVAQSMKAASDAEKNKQESINQTIQKQKEELSIEEKKTKTLVDLFDKIYGTSAYSGLEEQVHPIKNGELVPYDGKIFLKKSKNGFIVTDQEKTNEYMSKLPKLERASYDSVLHTHPFSTTEDGLRFSFKDIETGVKTKIQELLLMCGDEILQLKIDPQKINSGILAKWQDASDAIISKFGGVITENGFVTSRFMTDEQKNAASKVWNSYIAEEISKYGGSLISGKYDRKNKVIVDTTGTRIQQLSDDNRSYIDKFSDYIMSGSVKLMKFLQSSKGISTVLSYAKDQEIDKASKLLNDEGDFEGFIQYISELEEQYKQYASKFKSLLTDNHIENQSEQKDDNAAINSGAVNSVDKMIEKENQLQSEIKETNSEMQEQAKIANQELSKSDNVLKDDIKNNAEQQVKNKSRVKKIDLNKTEDKEVKADNSEIINQEKEKLSVIEQQAKAKEKVAANTQEEAKAVQKNVDAERKYASLTDEELDKKISDTKRIVENQKDWVRYTNRFSIDENEKLTKKNATDKLRHATYRLRMYRSNPNGSDFNHLAMPGTDVRATWMKAWIRANKAGVAQRTLDTYQTDLIHGEGQAALQKMEEEKALRTKWLKESEEELNLLQQEKALRAESSKESQKINEIEKVNAEAEAHKNNAEAMKEEKTAQDALNSSKSSVETNKQNGLEYKRSDTEEQKLKEKNIIDEKNIKDSIEQQAALERAALEKQREEQKRLEQEQLSAEERAKQERIKKAQQTVNEISSMFQKLDKDSLKYQKIVDKKNSGQDITPDEIIAMKDHESLLAEAKATSFEFSDAINSSSDALKEEKDAVAQVNAEIEKYNQSTKRSVEAINESKKIKDDKNRQKEQADAQKKKEQERVNNAKQAAQEIIGIYNDIEKKTQKYLQLKDAQAAGGLLGSKDLQFVKDYEDLQNKASMNYKIFNNRLNNSDTIFDGELEAIDTVDAAIKRHEANLEELKKQYRISKANDLGKNVNNLYSYLDKNALTYQQNKAKKDAGEILTAKQQKQISDYEAKLTEASKAFSVFEQAVLSNKDALRDEINVVESLTKKRQELDKNIKEAEAAVKKERTDKQKAKDDKQAEKDAAALLNDQRKRANTAASLYEKAAKLEPDYRTALQVDEDKRNKTQIDTIKKYEASVNEAINIQKQLASEGFSKAESSWNNLISAANKYRDSLNEALGTQLKNTGEALIKYDKYAYKTDANGYEEFVKTRNAAKLKLMNIGYNMQLANAADPNSEEYIAAMNRAKVEAIELDTIMNKIHKDSANFIDTKNVSDFSNQITNVKVKIGELLNNKSLSGNIRNTLKGYVSELDAGVVPKRLGEIGEQVDSLGKRFSRVGNEAATFTDRLKTRFQSLTTYLATFISFYQVVNVVKEITNAVKEFDTALTEMRKVSNESVDTLKAYQKQSFDMAKSIGTDALSLQNSTADFMRLGQTLEEAKDSAMSANVLMNVSEFESIDQATDSLIAMKAAYKDLDNMQIIDKLNEVGKFCLNIW